MKVLALSLAVLFTLSVSSVSVAQSGARSSGGGSVRVSGGSGGRSLSAGNAFQRQLVNQRERALIQQRQQLQFQELARQNRALEEEAVKQLSRDLLVELGANRDSSQNRRQRQRAFKEAKKEYVALKRKEISVSDASQFLSEPFRLISKEIDRDKRTINWPKPLLEPDHEETIAEIDERLAADEDENAGEDEKEDEDPAELTSADLNQLLSQINLQLGERVLSRDISAANYAIAKRFVTGLSNDGKDQSDAGLLAPQKSDGGLK